MGFRVARRVPRWISLPGCVRPHRSRRDSTEEARIMVSRQRELAIQTGGVTLSGTLVLPEDCAGIVVFSHGSGSSRFSPRNRYVADYMIEGGLGTLLFDLLTDEEHEVDQYSREFRFDIGLLTRRLTGAVDWLGGHDATRELKFGLFGSSTGAASALNVAAARPNAVGAVVSRGGRPDLAIPSLPAVRAPTLLVVGELDEVVIGMNREAAAHLRVECEIAIVPGATHLFEEPGTLEQVARLARDWFIRFLGPSEETAGTLGNQGTGNGDR